MDLLEGGIRVPLVARWPRKIAAGSVSAVPNLTMDWTATMLAVAGVNPHPDYPFDGMNLLPLFAASSWDPVRDLCWRMKHREQRALIRRHWKYLAMDGSEYLFNLALDERERANLAQREPQLMADLRAAWMRWNEQMPPVPEDAKVSLVFTPQQIPQATF
jgi:arylsulfatase A-like enzyme